MSHGSRSDAGERVTPAARDFLEGLGEEERRAAHLAFPDEDARRDWTYLPGERRGLAMAEMSRAQAKAAHRLLASGLSSHAYAQAAVIMALEDVLDELQGGRKGRHSGDYWLAVFGDPGRGPWGWRLEGHHLSVNYTVTEDGAVRATPLFLGANPARLQQGDVTVLEPLAAEEHLAFSLLGALSPAERAAAVISDEAPSDIVSRDQARLEGIEPKGVRLAGLAGEPWALARALVALYVDRLPAGVAALQRELVAADDLGDIRLAWAGEGTAGRPHYYRLQGTRFFVELDNTQDDANHVHTVYRDPEGDFGGDVLAAHHRAHHAPTP
jgi:hypothetical protein